MFDFEVSIRLLSAATRALYALLDRATQQGDDVKFFTYSELNHEYINMETVATGHMGQVLDIVRQTCLQNGIPDLAALVVNKTTRKPGDRYLAHGNWEREVERIREFDWTSIRRLDTVLKVRMLQRT